MTPPRRVLAAALVAALSGGLATAVTPSATAEVTPAPSSSPAAAAPDELEAAAPVAANTPPVAVDEPPATVVAGQKLTLAVLANDTDDGLGRPAGEQARLEVATFGTLSGRVTRDSTRTKLVLATRATDAGRTLTVSYTATDGELVSATATGSVAVTAPPKPPARTVSLTTAATLVALRAHTLRGTVAPRSAGVATVAVQRRVGGGSWSAYRSDRTDAAGRYAVRFSTNRATAQSFRAVATWRDGKRATSATTTRTVVARSDVVVSGPLTRASVRWSYRAGCPVRPAGLRRITVNRFTYSGTVARGSLVVSAGAVRHLREVFQRAFDARFPLRSMRPADAFYAGGRRTPTQSDLAAMRADNTSAFNCRPVTGNPFRVSQHSYGNAIDINTVRNPYVVGSRVFPSFARTYLDRRNVRTGMITSGSVIASTMRGNGWPWGARWSDPDYQHFSANGG